MWRLPLWTAKVRPTKSGVMVERRDQVLIAGGRAAPERTSSTFFSRCLSMNGPFLTERAMSSLYTAEVLLHAAVAHDHVRGALVLARLVAARRLAPGRHGVTAARGLALAAAVRVVYRVHRDAAHRGADALPARAARLAVRDVLVLDVPDLPDGRVADHGDAPDLARGHAHLRVVALLGDELREAARRAHELAALAGPELDVVNLRAERDVPDGERVPRQDVGLGAAHHGLAHFEPGGRQDVALLAVEVGDERDVRRAVRVVLDLRDAPRNPGLVALEVHDAVEALVAAAAAAHRDVAVVVAARDALLRLQQTLLGLGARRQLVARQVGLVPARRRCRCQFLDAHNVIFDSRFLIFDLLIRLRGRGLFFQSQIKNLKSKIPRCSRRSRTAPGPT